MLRPYSECAIFGKFFFRNHLTWLLFDYKKQSKEIRVATRRCNLVVLRAVSNTLRAIVVALRGVEDTSRAVGDTSRGVIDTLRGVGDILSAVIDTLRGVVGTLRRVVDKILVPRLRLGHPSCGSAAPEEGRASGAHSQAEPGNEGDPQADNTSAQASPQVKEQSNP